MSDVGSWGLPNSNFGPWIGQCVPSADGSYGPSMEGPFEIDGKTMKNNKLLFGRTLISCSDRTNWNDLEPETPSEQYFYAEITHSGAGTPSMRVLNGSTMPENSVYKTYRLLYYRNSDGDVIDYRFMPSIAGAT